MADISNTVIPLIFLIIVIIVIGIVSILLAMSGFNRTSNGLQISCASDQCATNMQSGFKRCPIIGPNGQIVPVLAEAASEVCNSQFACDNPVTPFAVQTDGSTNMFGVCPSINGEKIACPCLRNSQCADYVVSYFATNGGNAYAPNNNPSVVSAFGGQRISFPQVTTSTLSSSGVVSDATPLSFNNPGTNFCAVPAAWLPLSGCGFISSNEVTLADITTCMAGGPTSEPAFAPCNQGVLAFISDDATNFTADNINDTLLSCVRGTACPAGQVNVYDTNLNGIVCKSF